MMFWLRLFRLYLLKAYCELDVKMSESPKYRKRVGGKWYHITEMETGDTYWTQLEPSEYHAMIHDIEEY